MKLGPAWSETPIASASVTPYDIAVVSAGDAWMVGGLQGGGTMAQHFDGTSWTIVPTPVVGIYTFRNTLAAAIDANDVWAVGQSGPAPTHRR